MSTRTAVDDAIDRLRRAAITSTPCPPIRDVLDPGDIDAAYRVQQGLIEDRVAAGAVRVGRKIGLTAPVVQQQLGVDQPDFGVLLDDMSIADGSVVEAGRLLQARVEAEVAFVLGADLDGRTEISRPDVLSAVQTAHAAIEIVDSRVAGWDISIVDTVADNASSGLFVLSPTGFPLTAVSPIDVEMSLTRNGQPASSGNGRACLGDPINALLWLARTASRYGDPLRCGDVVLSGALGPMVDVAPGDHIQVELTQLGPVSVSFAKGRT